LKQRTQLETKVERWIQTGLIDSQTGQRILDYEHGQEHTASLRWPVFLAMAFGGILFAAGITLFVAAHWAELSPGSRYSLLLLTLAILHGGGAALAQHFPVFSTTLHGLGTAALGPAIFLTAQIFNLHENWATGVLLWSLGAAVGVALLRDWVQVVLLAILLPVWLISEWMVTTQNYYSYQAPLMCGLVLTALTYSSARMGEQESYPRRALVWVGSIALIPCAAVAVFVMMEERVAVSPPGLPFSTLVLAWVIALIAPLLLGFLLRGKRVWINMLWAVWAYALIIAARWAHYGFFEADRHGRGIFPNLLLYCICAIGGVGLVAWGLQEKRKERVNLGIAAFAISLLFFYFDSFMGKLGRSFSLLLLGLLCLAGGYALEMTRRKLLLRMVSSP
jgi:uncharacterized membrane protein